MGETQIRPLPEGFVSAKPCKCGATMLFLKNSHGTLTPVDAKSEKRWVQTGTGWAYLDVWTSHFVTCPNAGEFWRKK